MLKKHICLSLVTIVLSSPILAQDSLTQTAGEITGLPTEKSKQNDTDTSFFSPGGLSEEVNPFWTPEDTEFKKTMRYSILIGVPVVHLIYGFTVWNWGEEDNWRWADERWYQKDTDSGGADKTGHFFAHYAVTRISYSFFSFTEQSRSKALFYSAFTAALVGTMIEVGDAFTGEYGFSYEDLTVDFAGVAVAVLLDRYRVLDEFIGITMSYWPSEGFRKDKDKTPFNFAGDYSGLKWMVNFKLAGFKYLGFDIPEFMKYIQLDAGYYTRDYTDYDEKYKNQVNPERHLYVGVSVNMREVARDFFKTDKKSRWLLEQPFKYYHVPVGYEKDKTL